jgi:hypothetical protein
LKDRIKNRQLSKEIKPGMQIEKDLKPIQYEDLLKTLKDRFEKNMNRHKDLEWSEIHARLEASPRKLRSLSEMENTEILKCKRYGSDQTEDRSTSVVR